MIKKIKGLNGFKIFLSSVVILIVGFILNGVFTYGYEIILIKTGKMQTITLSPLDFELIGIVDSENGGYIATDSDPQLILTKPITVSRIAMDIKFSVLPGEINGYYTKKEGQGFSQNKRFWFYKNNNSDSIYTASFTLKKMNSIRIDPTTVTGNRMQINSITINPPQEFFQYFLPDFGDIFNLLIYSGIFAAVGSFIKEIVIKMLT